MEKIYLDANQLLDDAYELGFRVLASGYRPSLLLAIWRGGTPVGIAIQELLAFKKIDNEHFALRTSHYNDIDSRREKVTIHNFDAIASHIHPRQQILIVDDVFDTGLSIDTLTGRIEELFSAGQEPEIRVATVYFKPGNNRTRRQPDYYLHSTDKWVVFPHEIAGLGVEDILANKTTITAFGRHLHTLTSEV